MKKKLIRISTIPLSLNVLLQGQLKMLSDHYDVVAVSSPGKDLEVVAQREGVRTVEVPMERHISPLKDLVSLYRLIRLFWKEKPDIVHSLTPKAGLLSMMAGWICRVPVRIHMFTGLVFPSVTGLKQKIVMFTDRLTCLCATVVNPEGVGVKRDLEKYHITSKPMQIIGNGNVNGIDLTYYDRKNEVMERAKSFREKGCFTFCFVGRMVRDKGINELVSAFCRLYEENKLLRLILVGPFEDDLDPVLPETKEKILHHDGIRFMDWQDDIRPFLTASDAFVFPSYREGFPNVVIQAGAMGLPSIVTDINGCSEIIVNGQNGVIIPAKDEQALYDAMDDFIHHHEKIEDMAQHARKMVAERYDRQALWKALLDFYQQLEK